MASTAWTPELTEWTVTQWNDGWSADRIAKALGMTRNQVIGKVSRLGLGRAAPAAPATSPRSTKPSRFKPEPPQPTTRSEAPASTAPVVVDLAARRYAPVPNACKWPIGDPRQTSFRFCDAVSVAGRPYCAGHCAIAYVKAPAQRRAG